MVPVGFTPVDAPEIREFIKLEADEPLLYPANLLSQLAQNMQRTKALILFCFAT